MYILFQCETQKPSTLGSKTSCKVNRFLLSEFTGKLVACTRAVGTFKELIIHLCLRPSFRTTRIVYTTRSFSFSERKLFLRAQCVERNTGVGTQWNYHSVLTTTRREGRGYYRVLLIRLIAIYIIGLPIANDLSFHGVTGKGETED